ncbi:MAG: SLATT domain-containing protein [Desulfobulbaceae bacterium]|nr:SLATT domain-containing protein [Desulfobulbaceae bacterium]
MSTFTPEIEKLATDWFRRCRESQMVHYEYGSLLERRHLYFGIPAIVLSTIVGTAVFSSFESSANNEWLRVVFGMLSMLAASITALQTFLNLSDRAAKHKSAGANYGAIRRELELLKTMPPHTEDGISKLLENIKIKMDDLAESSPGIPSKFKQKIDERLKSKNHRRIYELYKDIE